MKGSGRGADRGSGGIPGMSQTVRIMCPNLSCRKLLAVPESARSKTVRCKACHTAIRVPEAQPAQPAQPPVEPQQKSA